MSTRGRRSRGRPPKTPVSINRTNFLRKPKAYQNLEQNSSINLSYSPSPVSHFKSCRSDRIRGRLAASRGRQFVSHLIAADDDDNSSLPDFDDRSSEITDPDNTDAFDNDADGSDASFEAELEAESSDESLSTVSSSVGRKRVLMKRPKTPDIPDDKEIPQLELPASATDLLLPADHVLQAIGIYEVLRHFRIILRLSPFTFEDFCACLLSEEQSNLLSEIHVTLLKALFREEETSNTTFGPQDLKDGVNISLFFLDPMTWPEVLRSYLDSEKHPEYRAHLAILESPDYPFVPYGDKLKVLQTLTDLFLATAKVREEIVNEGNIHYDDHCRACHKLGDLLCCETCSAVYHLACVEPPMQQVPEDDWLCSVCRAHQVKGVTDCVSEAEKSGLLCRQEAVGYDRHARKYWFLCRRIIVEGEKEVRYYSTKYQLEELLECLNPAWEQDLITLINEMKDDIVKQMSYTEELTTAVKGSRKSVLEIENAQLVKIQAERAAKKDKEAEEKRAREEEEKKRKEAEAEKTKNKSEEDDSFSQDESDLDKSSEEVVESESVVTTEKVSNSVSKSKVGDVSVTQVVETTTTTTTVTTIKSSTTVSESGSDQLGEPPAKKSKISSLPIDGENLEKAKGDEKLLTSGTTSLVDAIKQSTDGKPKVINLQSLLPAARQTLLNAVDKNGDDKSDGATKTVLLVNREGGKVTLQVQRQPVNKDDQTSSITQSTITTTVSASETRKMLTRSKTGSLTPKLFTDSITMTTTSMKATGKTTEEVLVVNKDGELTRMTRGKISVTSSLVQQSLYFKLGAEGSYKQYQNQYTTNTLALNKYQHNEERDKKRHLSHKFSLTQNSEFKWNGNVMGNRMSTLATLRLSITQLEGNIQAPFLHINWPNHRQNWQKAVQMCQDPGDFALALSILEACIKPCVINSVWHESLGHLRLNRITVSDREEWKKKEKEQRKRKEDEEVEVRPVIWIKYTMGLKHQVWKQKGEEYRVTGGNGWQWISSTRNIKKAVPQDSVGLRLVAQRLRTRRLKAARTSGKMQRMEEMGEDVQGEGTTEEKLEVKEEKMETEDSDSKAGKELKTDVKKDLDIKDELMEVDDNDNKGKVKIKEALTKTQKGQLAYESFINYMKHKYKDDTEAAFTLEILKQHPEKVEDVDLVNVSDALQKRNYYPKVTKPYSKLDNLLERRLKQDELERKQRFTIETQIALKLKLTQAIELAKKNKAEKEIKEKEEQNAAKLTNGDVAIEKINSKRAPLPYTCYSILCRLRGKGCKYNTCYSPYCRSENLKEESPASSDLPNTKLNGSESADSSNRSSKEGSPSNLPSEDTMDSKTSQEEGSEKGNEQEQNGTNEDCEEDVETVGLNKENEQEQNASVSAPADTSMEDEEIDIEGDKEGTSSAASKLSTPVNQPAEEAEKKQTAEAVTSMETKTEAKATSVSDIVKNLVIKTMAEKAVAAGVGKSSLLTGNVLTNALANVSLEELKAKVPPKRTTADKVKLAKLSRIGVKKVSRITKNGRLPMCHKFETHSKKKSIFVLDRNELRKMARQGAKRESVFFNYNCKMTNVCWNYPCPRPYFKTAWRYRTMTLQSLSAAALQLRILWACIKWDDMAAKPPAGGTNTISTETEITTTELLKRREVGIDGLRSEFLVRKIVVPLGVPDRPKEKYTPQRSGLRERKRIEAVRQTEPSVTEVWVPEEALELWEIKQFGEKLEKQRQALLDKADKSTNQLTTVSASQNTAQIKAQMEQQLKQQRLALAQKRIQENQGIKIGTSPSNITTLAASSTTTIIINNGTQLGKPGTTFKTLTVSSPGSLLPGGIIKTMQQPKTIIANAGSLLGTQLRPGIQLQLPGSTIQVRSPGIALAPKTGITGGGTNTVTRLVTPGTITARVATPTTPQGTKTQTIQIRPQTAGQPVQNLHFTQTPGGQLQVRGLLPGQIIQRMPDGKLQIITLSTVVSSATTTTAQPAAQQAPTPRPAITIRPQTIMVSSPGTVSVTTTPTVTQNRLVIPAQLATSLSLGQTSTSLTAPAIRQVLASSVAPTPSKTVIINRPGGPQIISAQNLTSVLGGQSTAALGSVPAISGALSSAVVISAPGIVASQGTPGVATMLVNNTQTPTLLSSLTSPQVGQQQTIISTLKPAVATVATTTTGSTTSLLGGQIIQGTSLLQRATGGTSLLNIAPVSGTAIAISSSPVTSQIPKLLASPTSGAVVAKALGSTGPQLIIRPGTTLTTAAGQAKVITAQQLRGLVSSPVQSNTVGASLSPIKTVISPQPGNIILPAGTPAKTLTAVRSLTPQLTLQTTGQQQVATTPKQVVTTGTSLLTQGLSLTTSPDGGVTSPTPGTSPGAGGGVPKYEITPQVVEQVLRQALLQNQAPEIQQKLLAMQKQIQQQQQSQPSSSLTVTSTSSSSSFSRRSSQGGLTSLPKLSSSSGELSRSKTKGMTSEQKEEQIRNSICAQVMKNILDRIERDEKLEQRNKKKQESAEEKQKRIAVMNQQKALAKHKEILKKEILRKRSLMEKNLQQEIYNEMADKLKKTGKGSTNTAKSPQPGSTSVVPQVATVAASLVTSPPPGAASTKVKKDTLKTLVPVTDPKSAAAQKRKHKLISTGGKGLNPKEKLYCICKTPYDESKFYIGCDLCSNWFHGACVSISEDRAKYIDSYICEDCRKQQEHISEELYCLCQTPYDENQFYIGCDRCQDWFHGDCVGISKHEADSIEVYVCPNCQKQEVADPIAQKPLTSAEYQQLQKLLKDLQAHKMAWPFLQPVDPKEVPDYYDIVHEPMDLTIVEAKLNSKAYHKLNDFMKDITKIFDNCRLYNPVDTAYFQCAEVVETYFAQKVKSLRSANKL